MAVKHADGSSREPMLKDDPEAVDPAAKGKDISEDRKAVPKVGVFALFRYTTTGERVVLVIGLVASVAQGCTQPMLAFFMKDLFQGIFQPDEDKRNKEVLQSFITFMIIGVVSFLTSLISVIAFARVADNIAQRLRQRFFAHLLEKDVGWFDSNSAAEMSTRLTNDTFDFREGVGEKFAALIQTMVLVPAGFAVAFTQSWYLTLFMLVAIPFMGFGIVISFKFMTKASQKQQQNYAEAGGVAETSLSSIRTVAAFNGYDREIARYEALLTEAEKNGIRSGMVGGFFSGFMSLVIFLTCAFAFWIGSTRVVHDLNRNCWESNPPFGDCFTGGTMLACLFAVLFSGFGIGRAAPSNAALSAARSAAARIYDIVDKPPAFDKNAGERLQQFQGNVSFREVTFSYPTRPDTLALNKFSFEIPSGTSAAFVGPSGSGKSTTVALLQRFYDPSQGCVLLDGKDIRELNLLWLRSQMALVQQEPVLFGGSILENIGYGKHGASREDVIQAAKAANAHGFISAFTEGYEVQVGERGTQLSGGQKQRIAIARAIVRDPKILLLDEATSALDSESERIVQEALDKLLAAKARTTLVIAHRLSTVKDVDRIFVLENGVLLESGPHAELVQKPGSLYAQLLKLQAIARAEEEEGEQNAVVAIPKAQKAASGISKAASSQKDDAKDVLEQKRGDLEDNAEMRAPTARIWRMQSRDAAWLALAFLATAPVGFSQPFMGTIMGDTTNTLAQPAVEYDVSVGKWVLKPNAIEDIQNSSTKLILIFIGIGAVSMLGAIGQNCGFRKSAETLTRYIRSETFKAMLRQEISWFDMRTTGQLADRLASEAPLIKSFTGEQLGGMLQMSIAIGGGIGLALYASWRLTLCNMLFIPLMMIGMAARMQAMRGVNEDTSQAGPLVSEAMGNVRTVAAFGMEEKILLRYDSLLSKETAIARKGSTALSFSTAWSAGMNFFMFGAIVFVANIFINHGWMEADKVMQVLFPIMFCAQGAAMANQWFADKQKAQAAMRHIFHTLDREPLIDAYQKDGLVLQEVRGELCFKHVAFRYPARPDVPVFTDFDLTIPANSTVAFVGPSGSGKSTTVGLLQRFYDPDSGSVCLDGHDLRSLNLAFFRSQMALVQQEPILFGGSILDNIAYGKEGASREEVEKAARSANAHGFIESFPSGYNTSVGERGAQLSGGQKQRVAIARAMIRDPKVLLLDEATSALDSESEKVVQQALDSLLAQKSRTTLMIAHRLATVVNSDMICVIYDGRIVEKGIHSELMRIPDGHYKQLAARQQADP